MAKKQRKGSKKGKKEKHVQFSRSESNLRRYWQDGRWDAFVTLFVRKQVATLPDDIRDCWDDAVFNLLVQTLFVDKAPDLLPSLFETLKNGPRLSSDVQLCLELTQLYRRALDVKVPLEKITAFPEELPAPFSGLRAAMLETMTPADETAQDLQSRTLPKRTTDPGLKLLKSFVQSYEKLRQANFQPKTISSYNTWYKHADSLIKHLDKGGVDKAILRDLHVLIYTFKELFRHRRNEDAITDVSLITMLKISKISYADHPVLLNLWTILVSQTTLLSAKTRNRLIIFLRIMIPAMADSATRGNPRLAAIQSAFRHHSDLDHKKPGLHQHELCRALLRTDAWTLRERYILMILGMTALKHYYQEEKPFSPFFDDDDEDDFEDVTTNIAAWLAEISKIQHRLRLPGQIRHLPFELWDNILFSCPYDFLERQLYFLRDLTSGFPFPKKYLLFLAMHADAVYTPKQACTIVAKFSGNAPGHKFSLTEQECNDLVAHLDLREDMPDTLQSWRPWLEDASWMLLVDVCARELVQNGMRMTEGLFIFSISYWDRVEEETLKFLAEHLTPASPWYGFFQMVSQLDKSVLPRKRAQAALFLDNFPPDAQALSLFDWFLGWRSNPYGNKFLLEVLSRVKQEATRTGKWLSLVKKMLDTNKHALLPDLLHIWEAEGWIQNPPDQQFIEALRLVQASIRPKTSTKQKRKATKRKQQRSLF